MPLENYRANYQFTCSIEKLDFGNLLYFTGHDLLLAAKSYEFCKVKFLNFDRFVEIFCVILKTTLSNLR